MKIKLQHISTAVIVAFGAAGSALAEEDAIINQQGSAFSTAQIVQRLPLHEKASITQTGNRHLATVLQDNAWYANATVTQQGESLHAVIRQVPATNAYSNNANATVFQAGSYHTALIDQIGSNYSGSYTASGIGNGVQATIRQVGGVGDTATITQNGPSLRNVANVRQEGVSSGIVTLTQTGEDSVGIVTQSPGGDHAQTTLKQTGSTHWAEIAQSGFGDVVNAQQSGAHMTLTVSQSGPYQTVNVTQSGDYLLARASQSGAFNEALITQTGFGNKSNVIQTGMGTYASPNKATVTQSGSGSFTTLVTQSGGAGNTATVTQN